MEHPESLPGRAGLVGSFDTKDPAAAVAVTTVAAAVGAGVWLLLRPLLLRGIPRLLRPLLLLMLPRLLSMVLLLLLMLLLVGGSSVLPYQGLGISEHFPSTLRDFGHACQHPLAQSSRRGRNLKGC